MTEPTPEPIWNWFVTESLLMNFNYRATKRKQRKTHEEPIRALFERESENKR